jgi:hypothetical protein
MNDRAHVLCRRGPREAARCWLLPATLLALCFCAGCPSTAAPRDLVRLLQDEDPAVRAQAAVGAGESGDRKTLPLLIDRLSDEEVDVRLMADAALRKIAGDQVANEMGWRAYDPPEVRTKAQQRWRQWLAGQGAAPAAASAPAGSGPSSRPAGRKPALTQQGSATP